MATLSSLPCGLRPPLTTLYGNGGRYSSLGSLSCHARSLSISVSGLSSSFSLSTGAFAPVRLSAKSPQRRGGLVVCEAASGKKPDQAAKRMRQNQKRRLRNKSRKSEIRSRTRRVFWELNALRKKKDASIEDVYRVEKMIAIIYSKIDKAVRVGVIHKNAASHRKSRLARRKKALLLFRGWYDPSAAEEENSAPPLSA